MNRLRRAARSLFDWRVAVTTVSSVACALLLALIVDVVHARVEALHALDTMTRQAELIQGQQADQISSLQLHIWQLEQQARRDADTIGHLQQQVSDLRNRMRRVGMVAAASPTPAPSTAPPASTTYRAAPPDRDSQPQSRPSSGSPPSSRPTPGPTAPSVGCVIPLPFVC